MQAAGPTLATPLSEVLSALQEPEGAAVEEAARGERFGIVRGDCLRVLKALPERSVDLILTDPAYSGMNDKMKFGAGRIIGKEGVDRHVKWFQEFQDDEDTFRRFLEACHRVLRDDRHLYIMFDSFSLLSLGHLVREVFSVKNLLVWDKKTIGMGHYFRRRFELFVFATKGSRKLNTRASPDVLRHKRLFKAAYPTQKPVALFNDLIRESTEPGFLVLDPFVGSASTGVAALQADCSFLGCDVSERATQVAARRLAALEAGEPDPYERDGRSARPVDDA